MTMKLRPREDYLHIRLLDAAAMTAGARSVIHGRATGRLRFGVDAVGHALFRLLRVKRGANNARVPPSRLRRFGEPRCRSLGL